MASRRTLKAAEAIREVVGMSIIADLQDPRIKDVTVTRVEVSGDMRHAKVYVSVMGDEKKQNLSLRGLQCAAGYLQAKCAKRIDTRYTPQLQFVMDKGTKHSLLVTKILEEVLPREKGEDSGEGEFLSPKYAVVMGAGKGTRMKSDLPKVLFPVCGRPMIEYVLDVLQESGVDRIFVVVGYRSDLVRETLSHRENLEFVEQSEQLGTGHAVMMCRDSLDGHEGPVMVVAGDCPMIQVESVQKLFEPYMQAEENGEDVPACILGTAHKEQPLGLGRIVRDHEGAFEGIVEEKDASEEQKKITEVNMSYYIFHTPDLLEALNFLKTDNAQGEYYITDAPAVLRSQGKKVIALPVLKPIESLGINTIDELDVVEDAMKTQQSNSSSPD